ncbi:MAG: TIGR01906 family membrane protein [Aquificaceae bacterium]|nr:TIGR01906 family membrane protein [Aquificaceae bacterium]
MKLIIKLLLIGIYPVFIVFLSARIAYTEPLVRLTYSTIRIKEDPLPKEDRLNLAILGLRAVTTSKGMEEFENAGVFNQKEINHMKDVKNLLTIVFSSLYFMIFLYLLSAFFLGFKELKKIMLSGAIFTFILIALTLLFAIISYETLFVGFHELFFKEDSWRFRDEDMLLRIYPMEFWFKSTVYAGTIGIFLCIISFLLGYFSKAKTS